MSVYLIYGVYFEYDENTGDSLNYLLDLIVPDLVEEYDYDDVWCCFDEKPHTNGYYCLNFNNNDKGILYISCYFHKHDINNDGPLEVPKLLKREEKNRFKLWLMENGIDKMVTLYTQTENF